MSDLLCALGHVATSAQLLSGGFSKAFIRSEVESGRVERVRRSVLLCSHAPDALFHAARLGGALTCVSALRSAGVWAGHSTAAHVQLHPHGSIPGDRLPLRDAVVHWHIPRFGMRTRWEASRTQALWAAIHCLDEEDAIAALESAIHEDYLPAATVKGLAALAPRSLRDGVSRLVDNSGSGNETIVRLRLARAGFAVESQPAVPGMGHHDLLVEGCVGVDVDGREWHGNDRFTIDRDRDLHLEGLGRRTLRLHAGHIHRDWPWALAVIDRAVSDARREATRRAGRIVAGFDDPW